MDWLLGPDASQEFNHWVFSFQNRPGWLALLLVGLGLLLLFWLSLRNLSRLRHRGWKLTLFGLRGLFALLLVLLWLEPAIQLQQILYKKSNVIFLVDESRSMSLAAAKDGQSRAGQVTEFFSANSGWLSALAERHHLHAFHFGAEPASVPLGRLEEPYTPDKPDTAIANAILKTLAAFNPEEVSGIVLLSDGVENPPDAFSPTLPEAAEALKKAGIQLLALAAGARGELRDMAVADLRYDGFAFVHNKVSIDVTISSRGYPERAVQVNLEQDGRPLGVDQVVVPENGEASLSFTFTPDRVGRYVYTVAIPPAPDDAFRENNMRRFVIDVIRDKIRVLHVCGHPDYDQQFLRRYFKTNPNVDLISFYILRTNADLQVVPERELSLIPFPTEELFAREIHTFDLIVFQNFTYRGYEMAQFLPNIRRFVERGGAFLVIGGDVSYGMGGYGGTPVEAVLPMNIVSADPGASTAPFKPVLTQEGLRHPIMRVAPDPEQIAARWERTPDLFGLNLGLVAHPEAVVLMEHPTLTQRGRPAPVIAARRVGEGRVLALTVDSSWRWHMEDIAAGGTGELYHSFWSNAIRWLIKDPELKHLSLRVDRDQAPPGGELRLDLRLTDEDFQPKPDAPIRVRVFDADEAVVLERTLRTDESGAAIGGITLPATEGMIRIEAVHVRDEEKETGRDEAGWRDEALVFVSAGSREFERVDVDREALRRLAEATGGWFYELPRRMDGETPFARSQSARVGARRDVPIWDKTAILLVLVLLIALEWWWRKRHHLN